MFKYQVIGEQLKVLLRSYKETDYGYITAAKINSLDEYNMLKEYYQAAKTPGGCYDYCFHSYPSISIAGTYEGPDWYFFEGEAGDRDSPSTYRLESLNHKKKEFEEFCKQYEDENVDCKCDGYRAYMTFHGVESRCMGTKGMEICHCNGNQDVCDFYDFKREKE